MVDFANQSIGGGVLGHGIVQEEQLFLTYTLSIVAMMLQIDPMTPDQAILIQNVLRTSDVDIKGIGYITDITDAGDYSKNKKEQYYKQNIDKDCHKVFVGFNHLSYNTVRSGLWGCGAFGGDPQLKFFQQVMVATYLHINLQYCLFSKNDILKANRIKTSLAGKTVADIYKIMHSTN